MAKVKLLELAHARSGDKGDTANVGVIAFDDEDYPLIVKEVTVEKVKRHFGSLVRGGVERFELPNLHALNFLLHGALDGGGTVSLMTDAQGKVLSTAMLRMEIDVPTEVAERVRGRGRAPAPAGCGTAGQTDVAGFGDAARQGEGTQVRTSACRGVTTLELARPERRNALGRAMVADLAEAIEHAGSDPEVHVVAIRGAGPDFCAGADLGEVAESQREGPEAGLEAAQELGGLFVRMRRTPKPIVAVVTGRALAGGCGLATACDLALAREDARFGYPEVGLGFVPAMAMALLRRKVGESTAFDLTVRGTILDAGRAAAAGLVDEVFPNDDFEDRVREYLAGLAARPPVAAGLAKRMLYGLDGTPFEDAVARGAEVNALARLTRECKEGVAAFLSAGKGG